MLRSREWVLAAQEGKTNYLKKMIVQNLGLKQLLREMWNNSVTYVVLWVEVVLEHILVRNLIDEKGLIKIRKKKKEMAFV